MAAHRKSDRRRVYLCAGGLRNRAFFAKQNRQFSVKFVRHQLRALIGAERRLLETVLIHKHRARLKSPLILAPRSSLHCFFVNKAPSRRTSGQRRGQECMAIHNPRRAGHPHESRASNKKQRKGYMKTNSKWKWLLLLSVVIGVGGCTDYYGNYQAYRPAILRGLRCIWLQPARLRLRLPLRWLRLFQWLWLPLRWLRLFRRLRVPLR